MCDHSKAGLRHSKTNYAFAYSVTECAIFGQISASITLRQETLLYTRCTLSDLMQLLKGRTTTQTLRLTQHLNEIIPQIVR